MTRENVLKLFPEATDEQITNLLNQHNSEITKEKEKSVKYKTEAEKAADLQKQLDEINNRDLSDIEKANKERDEALENAAKFENENKTMKMKISLAEQGIVGEQADKLIENVIGNKFDPAVLGQIISEREQKVIADYEKKTLQNTPNPDGGETGHSGGKDEKPEDVKIAEKLTFGTIDDSASKTRDYYK